MKNPFIILFITLCFMTPAITRANDSQTHGIIWENYEQALHKSQKSKKPIILFFTGSDWCRWCHKLDDEVLTNPEFAESVEDRLIFVKLDFPMHSTLPENLSQQNKQLQELFRVYNYPTLIILDASLKQIGLTGYRPGGPKEYASHLFQMIDDYTAYNQKMRHLGTYRLSGKDLKRLYQKAKELGYKDDANNIVKAGLNSELKHFFMTERYRFLVNEGRIHDDQAIALKEQILVEDSQNENLTHYQVALIDFEAYCEEMAKEKYDPELTVAPLVHYINKFGESDQDSLWRLNMVISQVYLDKNKYKQALNYAKASFHTAPDSAKPEIAMAIKNIQSKIDK